MCRECGRPLNVYGGLCDHQGEQARFMFENTIRSFREDMDLVRGAIEELKNMSEHGHLNLSKISPKVARIVSRDEISAIGRREGPAAHRF